VLLEDPVSSHPVLEDRGMVPDLVISPTGKGLRARTCDDARAIIRTA
jgi:hypothetical protein